MLLWVVRHAIAISRDDPACPSDPLRALTERGRDRMQRAARGLQKAGLAPDRWITSPYVRAVETADIVAAVLGADRTEIEVTDALEPGADPDDILGILTERPDADTVLFGHAPHCDALIDTATGAGSWFTALKKGGAACLELDPHKPASGTVLWLATPRILRHLGES